MTVAKMYNKTAIDWFVDQIENNPYVIDDWNEVLKKAKEIEKWQIKNAFKTGEFLSADYFDANNPHQECSENYFNKVYK